MSPGASSEVKFDIGHVLFIDIVGYSKLLIAEQSNQIQTLREIVRGTEQFKKADAEGKLLRLPTGDGGALVFRNSLEAPVLCALEISKALKSHPELKIRMGIHSGPVNEITDLNEQANIAGVGINMAQRVMDCGDAGHILLSKRVADDLEEYPQWRSHLSSLGECEVKHGTRVSVVNLYTDDAGNRVTPQKFRTAEAEPNRTAGVPAAEHRTKGKRFVSTTFIVIALMIVATVWFLSRQKVSHSSTSTNSSSSVVAPIPEKSIAVLPFDNLSRDPDNAYFAEGIQDEILTRLAKVADLKVIARTSTQKFKSSPENLPDIAKQLGALNILEGSVQKVNDQVRVNVQLINAMTNAHLWAEIYDRKLSDIFAVQSDIAKTVADTLQARLTGSERQMIAAQPTTDTEAYELYHKGRSFWGQRSGDNLPKSIGFYEQAIARDPSYALAYAGLANSYILLPYYTATPLHDAAPKARAAALKALQLDPNLAEGHIALGKIISFEDIDLSAAGREFQRAIELQPNNATAHHWYGNGPLAALGKFDEAIAEGKKSIELDPLSPIINTDHGNNLYYARRYDEAIAQLRKAVELDPAFFYAHYNLGLALQAKGDLHGAIAEYEKATQLSDDPFVLALLGAAKAKSGDKNAAEQALTELDKISQSREGLAYGRAVLYLSLGEKEQALHWLEQSFADRDGSNVGYVKVEPLMDPLRGDPRFEALVQKVIAPK